MPEVARLARELGIDIAVDLMGFTERSRTGIFACRAAPVQVNYLGYAGTLGSDYMDYLIADATLIPEQHRADYAEKIAWLPHTFQVNDSSRPISARQFTRRELGLPEQGFVFCNLNNYFKLTPGDFAIWMRLLKSVEGSVLWLVGTDATAEQNLRTEAQARGVSPERLVFKQRTPLLADHLAQLRLADLFVDSLDYNAHTTASDALVGRPAAGHAPRGNLCEPGGREPATGRRPAGVDRADDCRLRGAGTGTGRESGPAGGTQGPPRRQSPDHTAVRYGALHAPHRSGLRPPCGTGSRQDCRRTTSWCRLKERASRNRTGLPHVRRAHHPVARAPGAGCQHMNRLALEHRDEDLRLGRSDRRRRSERSARRSSR